MLRNKKKLRRIERRIPAYAARAAQTLVLTGALVLGVAGGAWAAGVSDDGDLSDGNEASSTWTIGASDTLKETGNTTQAGANLNGQLTFTSATQAVTAQIVGDGTNDTFTVSTVGKEGLTVTGVATGNTATLTIGGAEVTIVDTAGAIVISGGAAAGGEGTIIIDGTTKNATLKGTGTTVGAFGVLELKSGGDATKVATHVGSVILDDDDATLTIVGVGNVITSNLTINAGTVTSLTSTETLTVTGTTSVAVNGKLSSTDTQIGTAAAGGALNTLKLIINGSAANVGVASVSTIGAGGELVLMGGAGNNATHTGDVTLSEAGAKLTVIESVTGTQNTITGALEVDGGIVQIADSTADAFLTVSGASTVTSGTIVLGNVDKSGTLTATGGLELNGANAKLVASGTGADNTVTGAVTVAANGGTVDASASNLKIDGALAVDTTAAGAGLVIVGAGMELIVTGNTTLGAGSSDNGTLTLVGSNTAFATHTGNVTLDGEIAGAVLNAIGGDATTNANLITGDLVVASGTVNLGTSSAAGYLKVTGNAGFSADSVLNAYAGDKVLQVTTGGLTVDAAAKLNITGGEAGTYEMVTAAADGGTNIAGWTGANLKTVGSFMTANGEWNVGKTAYNLTLAYSSVQPHFTQLDGQLVGIVDSMLQNHGGLQPDSPEAGKRFLSRAISNQYLGENDATLATVTIEGASQMAAVAGVQVSTIGAVNAASGAVTTRTSFALPRLDTTKAVAVNQATDGTLSLDTGLSAGSGPNGGMKNGLGVWIMPLYQSNRTWGQEAGNFKSGMTSDLGGIALGADYTINDMFRFGAAFNVGGGYAESTGDFNKSENSFNFWGVSLYGGWTMNNFGLAADVGYTSNYNKVEQELPTAMQMGNLKADVTSSAWTAGLKGEYKIETSVVDIIPHVGVRYMGLTTDEYSVKSAGTVFKVEQDHQSIWTFPIGVALSKTIQSDSGWTFTPQLDLSIIPAAGDVDAKSKSRVPGVDGQSEMKMQVVDYVTYDGGVGFEVGKGDLSFGLNYNIQASEHRTGHGVFGTLRYEF